MKRSVALWCAAVVSVCGAMACAEEPRPVASAPPAATRAAEVNTEPLVHEAVLRAPIAEAWTIFTTEAGLKRLGAAKADVDFRVGGLLRSCYDPKAVLGDETTIHNQIIAYEPMRMVAWRISQPPKGFPFMNAYTSVWSVATFTDLGDGRTHLRLAMCGYQADDESQKMRAFFKAGNQWVMEKLIASYDAGAKAPTGPAHAARALDPIEKSVVVNVPREEAWSLFATVDGWKRMIAQGGVIDLKPGGLFEVYFDVSKPKGQRGGEDCIVLSYIRGEMMSFTWNAPPQFSFAREKRTWVVVNFEELTPGRTQIRLSQQGFADLAAEYPAHKAEFEQVRAYFDVAWGYVLSGAVKSAATGEAAGSAGP